MRIITPTYKRAGKIKAIELFKTELVIACHEFELSEYKKAYPDNEFMVLPDDIGGNMGKVRNYILHNCNTDHLVMIDDDVTKVGYHEDNKQITMELPRILEFLEEGFNIASSVGTALWGINLQSDPKFYREYSPFSFLSPVLGPFCCINTTDNLLEYDERLGLNEDYDFALQALYHYHKIVRFNKYYYMAGHLDESGGCGAYRTLKKEREQALTMVKKWGNDVVSYDFSKSTNPRINIPIKGI
jgi:hypothetical protein